MQFGIQYQNRHPQYKADTKPCQNFLECSEGQMAQKGSKLQVSWCNPWDSGVPLVIQYAKLDTA